MVAIACQMCGQLFTPRKRNPPARFCSRKCFQDYTRTPVGRSAIGDNSRQRWSNEQYKERTSASIRTAAREPTLLAKRRENMLSLWQRKGTELREVMKQAHNTPQARERHRVAALRRNAVESLQRVPLQDKSPLLKPMNDEDLLEHICRLSRFGYWDSEIAHQLNIEINVVRETLAQAGLRRAYT